MQLRGREGAAGLRAVDHSSKSMWKKVLSLKYARSTPQDLGLKEEGKRAASQDLGGPALPRVDFETQVGAMGRQQGRVSAVCRD